jgi:hypothetical protein
MIVAPVRSLIPVLCTILMLPSGCENTSPQSPPPDATAAAVCPALYQGSGSIEDAMAFIEVPEDRMKVSITSVRRQAGAVADQRQLAFANRLFSIRTSRDPNVFVSLLSDATRKELGDDNGTHMLHDLLREIKAGKFIYADYNAKFFATMRPFTNTDWDVLRDHISFAEPPSRILHYWFFHVPNHMLIGDTFYLVENGGSYRLVTETLRRDALPAERQL